jgi:hypothetical protein
MGTQTPTQTPVVDIKELEKVDVKEIKIKMALEDIKKYLPEEFYRVALILEGETVCKLTSTFDWGTTHLQLREKITITRSRKEVWYLACGSEEYRIELADVVYISVPGRAKIMANYEVVEVINRAKLLQS